MTIEPVTLRANFSWGGEPEDETIYYRSQRLPRARGDCAQSKFLSHLSMQLKSSAVAVKRISFVWS